MGSPLFLLLALCGYQAGAVHLLQTSGATTGPSSNTSNTTTMISPLPVAVVMFDSTYMRLFDCFLRYWARQINSKDRENKLDVVLYDTIAYRHVEKLIRKYPPGLVRKIQLREISPRARRQLSRRHLSRGGRSAWSSMVYQAYFWQAILERLNMGEDVLHMDIDCIVVGDAWGPIASYDPSADIVGTGAAKSALGQQYLLYRSTPATKALVGHFASIWEEWLSGAPGAAAVPASKPPLTAEQPALGEYITQYNPDGRCNKSATLSVCKTHSGSTFSWDQPASTNGLKQNGRCKFPEECRAQGIDICHSRAIIQDYCEPDEVYGAKHHP